MSVLTVRPLSRFASVFALLAVCAFAIAPMQAAFAQTSAADSSAHRRIQPLPALGSAPETGLQYGATVLGVWEPAAVHATRPASLLFYALRTNKQQTRVGIEGDYWTRHNAQRVAATLVWQEFPLPFYGIGDRTLNTAKELFTPKGVEATVTLQQRMARAWYATAGVRHLDQSIAPDTVGVLRNRTVLGVAGGAITEWSLGVLNDTRENLFAPRGGHWLQMSYARSSVGAWSDYGYGKLKLDARTYHALHGTHVVATHLQVTGIDGRAPFDQLALVGNSDIMRGYERGRFRDNWLAAGQVEYRTPVSHRLGAVAFGGAGMVAPSLHEFGNRQWLPTYGAGVRVQIDERQRTSVRLDYARGHAGASGLYIGFNQAF